MTGSSVFDRRLFLAAGAASLGLAGCQTPPGTQRRPDTSAQAIAFDDANWFNGETFERRSGWSVEGRLTFKKPRRVSQTRDMKGAFLVPPFGDAHSHSFATHPDLAVDRRFAEAYLKAGVFYVMSQGNRPIPETAKAELKFNSPQGVDVHFSHATLTSSDSALQAFTQMVPMRAGFYGDLTMAQLEGQRWITFDTVEEVASKWALVRAQRPDFIKLYIWNTEGIPLPPVLPPPVMSKKALSPPVVDALVKQAHADGLRVSAHVTTPADMRVGLTAGVDMFAHPPDFVDLPAEIARECAARRIPIASTTGMKASQIAALPAGPRAQAERVFSRSLSNLKLLKDAGARIVIGGDDPRDTTAGEAAYLQQLGWWDSAAMLRLWGSDTPKAIFPERSVGELSEGFEASFLALAADPLKDWKATSQIPLAFKQGQTLYTNPA